jgi:general secretion pathway protein H
MGTGAAIAVRDHAPERGFTLLEVIVVLLILSLGAAVSAPAIGRSLDSIRLRAEIAGFSAMIRHAREQAITSRRPHTVVVETGGHEIRVVDGEHVRRVRPLPSAWTIDTTPRGLVLRFEPQGSSSGGEYHIVAGTIGYRVTVDPLTGRVRSTRE